MHTTARTLFVLGAVVTAAGAPSLGAQQPPRVRVSEQVVDRRVLRVDSLVERILGGDVETVKRTVTSWRERETQLLRDQRSVPDTDPVGQRRVREQLALHARDGFAIQSAIQARCMREGGPRPPGYLGLNLRLRGELINGQLKSQGNFVTSVEPGSPAERAGMRSEDRVLSIAGLDALEQMPDIGAQLIPGRAMTVRVERDGARQEYTLTVARRPEGFGDSCADLARELEPMRIAGPGQFLFEDTGPGIRRLFVRQREPADPSEVPTEVRIEIYTPGGAASGAPSFFAGAVFRMLDADWGEVLGVRQGVIVGDVATGSPAALSGLKGGDVITAVGRSPVATPVTLVQILNTMVEREAVLSVVRAKEKKSITLKWSER